MILLGLVLFLSVTPSALGADSFKHYAEGHYSEVLSSVRVEMTEKLSDSSGFLTRLRLATNSFAQDANIPLEEMKITYDAAHAQADKWGYGERVKAEKAEVLKWLSREKSLSSDEVLKTLRDAMAQPRDSVEKILRLSTRIFALSLLARRKLSLSIVEPEWYFIAGKAVEADTQSGRIFFESYLSQSKNVKYRAEAQRELESIKRREDSE